MSFSSIFWVIREFSSFPRILIICLTKLLRGSKWSVDTQDNFHNLSFTHPRLCGTSRTKSAKKCIFLEKNKKKQGNLAHFEQKLEISTFHRIWNICSKMFSRCSKWRQLSQDHFITHSYNNLKHSGASRTKNAKKHPKMASESRLRSLSNCPSLIVEFWISTLEEFFSVHFRGELCSFFFWRMRGCLVLGVGCADWLSPRSEAPWSWSDALWNHSDASEPLS